VRGRSEDGQVVGGIPLSYDTGVIELYSRYGLALARINRCNEAVTVANALLQNVADNADGVFNANEIIRICEETCSTRPQPRPSPPPTVVTGPTATPQP